MNKPRFVISSPFDTYSGYGARARDIIKSIIAMDKYKVELLPQRWGDTSWGFCDNHPEWAYLNNHKIPKIVSQPDIWMQITIPNEFQAVTEMSHDMNMLQSSYEATVRLNSLSLANFL